MRNGERELQQFTRTAEPEAEETLVDFMMEAMEILIGSRPEPGEWKTAEGAAPGVDPHDLPVARNTPGEARCCSLGAHSLWALSPDGTLELVIGELASPRRLRLLRDEDTLLLSAVADESTVKALADAFKERFRRSPSTPS